MTNEELSKRLYVDYFDYWRNMHTRQYMTNRKLDIKTINNGILLPSRLRKDLGKQVYEGGICDENFNFIAGNLRNPYKKNLWCHIERSYTVNKENLEYINEDVVFGGFLIYHFGHMITHGIDRMWYHIKNPNNNKKFVFTKLGCWDFKDWIYQIFEILEISKDRILIIDKPTRFKSLTIPDQSVYLYSDYTKEFVETYDYILNKITPDTRYKKVFITKSRDVKSFSKITNIGYFENYFKNKGFEIIHPERLSIYEQFAIVNGADEIVTFYGTLSHFILFSKRTAKFTMLAKVSDDIITMQCMFNIIKKNFFIVDISSNYLYTVQQEGAQVIGPSDQFKRYVKDHFDDILPTVPTIQSWALYNYVENWCDWYLNKDNRQICINSIKKICNLYRIQEYYIKIKRPVLCYKLHLNKIGWIYDSMENDMSGNIDTNMNIEALRLFFFPKTDNYDIYYSVYYATSGWSRECSTNEMAGTTGLYKPIYGIRIRLSNYINENFNIKYRIYISNSGWLEWKNNNEETFSNQFTMTGLQIILEDK